jgi:flagellar L-ring protein precursor FlgH
MPNIIRTLLLLSATALTACADTMDKLENVGKRPEPSVVADPVRGPGYEPMSWPTPAPQPPEEKYAGSLWQPGSRAFFRDQRASRVGDILRINIKINDKAEVINETERKRDTTESADATKMLGLERKIFGALPGKADITSLVDAGSASNTKGTGNVKRGDKIETQVAVTITQVLPNGNFVVDGKQEMLINYDIREVGVKGVIRPQDIKSDNTVDSTQVAEARITYSGRGQLMDVQQPRWGAQVVDAVLPF